MENINHEYLKAVPTFKEVPDEQLIWLIDAVELINLQEGELLFQAGDPIDKTFVIIEGKIRICALQAGKIREIAEIEEGGITGFLPFSRAKNAFGYGECVKKARILVFSAEKVKAAPKLHYELTEALVHTMTSRVRDFTALQQQNEKMFALGKLSAGLAHELNNPAAAIARGASSLNTQIMQLPELFKRIVGLNIDSDKVSNLNNLFISRMLQDSPVRSMLDKASNEDELTDWLLENGIKDSAIAENLNDYSFSIGDLEQLMKDVSPVNLEVVLSWFSNFLQTSKMVSDIQASSHRISELVSSVKKFTHMDSGTDKQMIDIHSGIHNTLTMLDYKLKKGNIEVIESFDLTLPKVKALPGELNQVWTNIIDNAIDAMEVQGKGVLEITTKKERQFVQVFIKDNGPRIPEDIKSRIFDPFFTTKEMGKGTGLGLDIVTRIMRQHSGSVKVNSVPGHTEFMVCFPITDI